MKETKTPRPRGVDAACVVAVIRTRSFVGMGTEEDPCRVVTQYWSLEGALLATADPEEENKAEAQQ